MKTSFGLYAIAIAASFIAITPSSARAQAWAVDGHANYARTTQTHLSSWGAGAQIQATFGSSSAPVRLSTSLGGDWTKQEHDGPTTTSLGYDATLQPGGSGAITPYAGGSISANWLSGDDAPSGTLVGLEYIIGVQIKPESQGHLVIRGEARPGYVHTQEHVVTGRFGITYSF